MSTVESLINILGIDIGVDSVVNKTVLVALKRLTSTSKFLMIIMISRSSEALWGLGCMCTGGLPYSALLVSSFTV